MNRGFISGLFWGVIISFLLLAVVSLNGTLPGDAPPATGQADVPPGSQFHQSREDAPAALPGAQAVSKPPEAASPAAPEPDGTEAVGSAAKAPGVRPETGAPESTLTATPPAAGDSGAPEAPAVAEAPVQAVPADGAPDAPAGETEPVLVTESAAPPSPPAASAEAPVAQAVPTAEDPSAGFPMGDLVAAAEAPLAVPGTDGTPQPPAAGQDMPAMPGEVTAEAAPDVPATVETPVAEEARAAVETAPEAPRPEATPDASPAPEAAPAPEPAAVAEAPADGQDAAEQDSAPVDTAAAEATQGDASAQGAIPGRPAGRLTERGGDTRRGSLPSIGQDQPAGTETAAPAEAMPAADDPSLPPIRRYAAAFSNPEDKPLMSIVLMDDGTSATDATVLSGFPYPLTIAVDAAWDGAPEALAAYRAAGFETALLGSLPEGAQPRDVETSLESWFSALPEVTAVVEKPGLGLQKSTSVSTQLASALMQSGRGLVLFPNGFDTARKLAVKVGVPAATVFRDFDSDGQDADVIRRFLDHAAFRAGQEGGVIMIGRLRPETIQALLVWGLQDRASRVALAPISALLLDGAGADGGDG
ncbi:divergent polysaccharide deacteylase family protein [Oceanicola sp. 22II-s10i]|uniref:divergent polysaccharide deacteylase family protein n=1 Tax=Oceanicola sp. 22II-s10i TaxID=1317116 RepID=UPI000B524779|nr:divergent polysaccharide deacteylase family protein [Oceanicola sp. 22II-s10i]